MTRDEEREPPRGYGTRYTHGTTTRTEPRTEAGRPNPPTICKCGSAESYHHPQDQRDHEYEPRYEPMAWQDGYERGRAEATAAPPRCADCDITFGMHPGLSHRFRAEASAPCAHCGNPHHRPEATAAPPLDVERLAAALAIARCDNDHHTRPFAERIAAEYARLSESRPTEDAS